MIAYTGLHELFSCSVLSWPPPRPVQGEDRRAGLLLKAESDAVGAYLIEPLFTAEIAAIEAVLSVQADQITRWERSFVVESSASAFCRRANDYGRSFIGWQPRGSRLVAVEESFSED